MARPWKQELEEFDDNEEEAKQQSVDASTESESAANSKGICSRCSAIPIDDLLSHPGSVKNSNGAMIATLGSITQWDTPNCALCRLLLAKETTTGEDGLYCCCSYVVL
jgi:hypothetical protein